jgi:hypothetical protein
MAYFLLVTWFVYGQPPSSYQTVFDSERACGIARLALIAEAERMKQEVDASAREAAKRGSHIPAAASPPKLTAVCTPKS